MGLRQHYDESLGAIRASVVRMGNIASEMVRIAVESAMSGDVELAATVVRMDDEVDHLEVESLNRCVLVVMREAPVASDLRMLVSTMGVIGEIEKVADDAVKLARRATKLTGQFPGELKAALMELGECSRLSFASALKLYTEFSPELAQAIIDSDKEIDTQYKSARNRLFEMIKKNPEATAHLVRTIEVFHALEHVADHAVEIASRLRMHHDTASLQETATKFPAVPETSSADGPTPE